MSFYSCYFFNFSYYSFFLCYSDSLLRYYFSFFCFFMNYSYSFSFSYFISNGLKRDSDCCPPFISSILSFMSNNLRWIYVDWSRNILNFRCFNYSSLSPYLALGNSISNLSSIISSTIFFRLSPTIASRSGSKYGDCALSCLCR